MNNSLIVFAGNYLSHLLSLDNVHATKLTKFKSADDDDDDDAACLKKVEADIETSGKDFFLDIFNGHVVPKPKEESTLCHKTEVNRNFNHFAI
jgi:hypothetical protein